MTLPLFDAHPQLARSFPVAGLMAAATPIEPLSGADGVFIKRDDVTAADYGGNKIRKLDFLLAHAKAHGRRSVVAFGYAGSNFVAATAWHARKLGLRTIGGLLPQVAADYIVDNLSVSLAAGAELFLRESEPALIAEAAARSVRATLRDRRWPAWIPPGGSNAVGALGFVNAVVELKAQIDAGAMPPPAQIVVAFSSMGSVAGLAAGLALAGLGARITAVQVVDPQRASQPKLLKLADALVRLLRAQSIRIADAQALVERVDIRGDFFGGEYARADAAVKSAMARFARDSQIRVDSAYTGKALAALYADLDAGRLRRPSLYWHTLSRSTLPPGVRRAMADQAPASLRSYWNAA
ncbi:MAG TPA: pyridoxal-phosphate dependent enzyme [Nevskiaceae bacterium]|nr:pyridoxal-phosphate dependent enzyme [Nevskiaceae bacterium]